MFMKIKRNRYPNYKRALRIYRRKLKKQINHSFPFDIGYLLELLETYLMFMLNYYEIGENVHSEELEDHNRPTKLWEAIYHLHIVNKLECDVSNEEYIYHWNMFWDILRTEAGNWSD